jgi:hypothetical protein
MPQNKKQHYVPTSYLRNFASSPTGKSINIYHLPSHRSILDGNLRNQCYGNYFYGKDGHLERGFADLDGAGASLVTQILSTDKLPVLGSPDHLGLTVFIVLQRSRTQHSVETYEEAEAKFVALLPDEQKLDYELHRRPLESVILPLQASLKAVPVVLDLGLHLLINNTTTEFVTSDNPVVLHNQYCEGAKGLSSTGWASLGLQVLFPLSPSRCLFMYDRKVYKVGDHRNNKTAVEADVDIALLNRMQWLSAHENIYYAGISQEPTIRRTADNTLNIRQQSKAEVRQYLTQKPNTKLLHYYSPDLPIHFDVSFCKLRREAKRVSLQDRCFKARNPELASQVVNLSEKDIMRHIREKRFSYWSA